MDQGTQDQTQTPGVGTAPQQPAGGAPQNQDKSDAMTYPLGSQNASTAQPSTEEDHRSILDRILGIFNRGKKDQPQEAQPSTVDQAPTNTTPPPGQ